MERLSSYALLALLWNLSGLVEALDICGKIEGIGVAQFNEKDVVRHSLVQRIIRAYEEYDTSQPPRAGSVANGKSEARPVEPDREPNRETQRPHDSH